MGNTASGLLDHKSMFMETTETRRIMNILLDYMLKNITVRDFLALSNPIECKKYVLFMANRLNQQFYELKITPEKDKKDVIAFRSIKELVSPDDRMDKEKQSLCLSIAYFYTRIFQIYGALALTLIDDIDATRQYETAIFLKSPIDTTDGLGTPGSAQVYLHGGSRGGGDLPSTISIGNYEFLRSYLRDERQEPYGYSVRYDETKAMIYFSKQNENLDERQQIIPSGEIRDVIYQNAQFAISYTGALKYTYLQMTASKQSTSRDIKLQIKSLQYIKKGASQYTTIMPIPSTILPTSTLTIQSERQIGTDQLVYTIKEIKNTTIRDFFNGLFNKLIPYIKELAETGESGTPGMPTPKNLLSPGFKTEQDIPSTFHIGRTIQNLQNQKPLAHCIARALQLLKIMPLGDEPGYSSVCKAHFLEIQGRTREGTSITYSRSGIPLPNDNLEESPGLSALSQLFYDTIAIGSPKLEINRVRVGDKKQTSLETYREFMLKMATLFMGDDKPPEEQILSAGLRGIKNRRDAVMCHSVIPDEKGSTEIRGDIKIDQPIAEKVKGIVSNLFKRQLKHAANCGNIFNMMFYINKDKGSNYYTVRLHDRVIQGGIPIVDQINRHARRVLMDYYSDCETQYMTGMEQVVNHYNDKQLERVHEKARQEQEQAMAKIQSQPQVAQPVQGKPGTTTQLVTNTSKVIKNPVTRKRPTSTRSVNTNVLKRNNTAKRVSFAPISSGK